MKLKSKLIATIVSICAAIAVMGVGVWAATSSFIVSVTNNVNVSFTKLSGDVSLVATAKTSTSDASAYTDAVTGINGTKIYEYSVQEKNYTINSVGGEETADMQYQAWDGTKLFTNYYINETIKLAKLEYVFTYKPVASATSAGYTTVAITAAEPTTTVKGATMTYTYSVTVEGGSAQTDVTGKTFYAADDKTIIVTITATYANPTLSSVKLGGETDVWTFSVAYANTLTAPTGTGVVALS